MDKVKLSEKLDYFFNKLLPKKLIVWIFATVFCFMGKIDGQMWTYCSMAYLAANGVQKFSPFIKKDEL